MTTPTTWSAWALSDLSGDTAVDGLIFGTQWASHTITFSFPTDGSVWSADPASGYGPSSGDGEPWNGYALLTAEDKTATRGALKAWSNVADLTFREVADNETVVGDIRFAYSALDQAQAQAYFPGETVRGGDVWFDSGGTSFTQPWTPGSYEYQTVLHELGHALGLKHPFEGSNYNPGVVGTGWDTRSFTVMSYSAVDGNSDTYFSYEPTTPMILDILAIQHLYGANTGFHAGNDTYLYGQSSSYHQTLWDAGGTDTISYRNATIDGTIDLREGYGCQLGKLIYQQDLNGNNLSSVFNIWISYGAVIENAVGGAGDDTITGNDVANVLDGGQGADTMTGGEGNDIYRVDNRLDKVVEASGGGVDTVNCALASYTLGSYVDNLRILATGAANGSGNSGANTLYAGAGNNLLDGGAGTDTVSYAYATAGVNVSLASTAQQATGGSGADTLRNVERLTGSAYADKLSGSGGANLLSGGAGNDTLIGGTGADAMNGGDGNDLYVVDDAGDVVTESTASVGTGGADMVYSSLAATTLGVNVENLRITATGTASGTGNASANILYAGSGNNVMNGGGGTDTVSYVYATGGVTVSLASTAAQSTGGSGTDRLLSIESLSGSRHDDRLAGNSGANRLSGDAGNDRITGGAGADTLSGGAGNDLFRFVAQSDGNDSIGDFTSGQDHIAVVAANFGLVAGATARVVVNGAATAAAGTFLYASATGVLRFDADGTGAGAAVTLATLTNRPASLSSANFVIGS